MKHVNEELPRDRKSLLQLIRVWGWKTESTSRGHTKITNRTGQFVYMSGTPSDYRALEKLRSDLKRMGLPPYQPLKEDKPLSEPKLVVSKVEGDSTTPVTPVVPVTGKKKGRPVKDAILTALRQLDKEEGVNADELLPHVKVTVPDITIAQINSSLSYYKAQGMVTKVAFSQYRIKGPKALPAVAKEEDDFAVLEEVLTVMAKLEGVLKRMKDRMAQVEAAKAAFNAIK